MFPRTVPPADRKLIGVVQTGPGLAWNCHCLFASGTAVPNLLLVRSAGTEAAEYNWMLLLVAMLVVPCTNHSPDVVLLLRKLSAAVKQESDLDVAAEASFHALKAKLPAIRQPSPESIVPRSGSRLSECNNVDADSRQRLGSYLTGRGAQLAIAASLLLAVIPLVMQVGRSPATAEYYTLSDVKPELSTAPQLRVVFKNSISDADLNAFLAQIHGQRIEGPNSIGTYTVQLEFTKDSPKLAAAIAFLRQQPNVMLAEPVFQP